MDHNKVSDYLLLIKQLVDSQVVLLEFQSKVDAVVEIALKMDLMDHPAWKVHASIQELNDSVSRAVFFIEDLINSLNGIVTLLMSNRNLIFDE